MAQNYTDETAVQNYTLLNIDASFTTQLGAWIGAMSRYMDDYCGRTLVDSSESTRKYDGNGRETLLIDEVHSITAVTLGGTTITPLQYPANTDRKYELVYKDNYFTQGRQNVEVTGKFAMFTTLPEDIKFACTVLVAGIIQNSNEGSAGVQSEKIGQYSVTYKDEAQRRDFKLAKQIMDMHRKLTV